MFGHKLGLRTAGLAGVYVGTVLAGAGAAYASDDIIPFQHQKWSHGGLLSSYDAARLILSPSPKLCSRLFSCCALYFGLFNGYVCNLLQSVYVCI